MIWLVASVILTPLVVFVLGPGLPPGNGCVEAHGQVVDNTVLLGTGHAGCAGGAGLLRLRARGRSASATPTSSVDGPPVRGNASVQFWWLTVTTVLVLFLAGLRIDPAAV